MTLFASLINLSANARTCLLNLESSRSIIVTLFSAYLFFLTFLFVRNTTLINCDSYASFYSKFQLQLVIHE